MSSFPTQTGEAHPLGVVGSSLVPPHDDGQEEREGVRPAAATTTTPSVGFNVVTATHSNVSSQPSSMPPLPVSQFITSAANGEAAKNNDNNSHTHHDPDSHSHEDGGGTSGHASTRQTSTVNNDFEAHHQTNAVHLSSAAAPASSATSLLVAPQPSSSKITVTDTRKLLGGPLTTTANVTTVGSGGGLEGSAPTTMDSSFSPAISSTAAAAATAANSDPTNSNFYINSQMLGFVPSQNNSLFAGPADITAAAAATTDKSQHRHHHHNNQNTNATLSGGSAQQQQQQSSRLPSVPPLSPAGPVPAGTKRGGGIVVGGGGGGALSAAANNGGGIGGAPSSLNDLMPIHGAMMGGASPIIVSTSNNVAAATGAFFLNNESFHSVGAADRIGGGGGALRSNSSNYNHFVRQHNGGGGGVSGTMQSPHMRSSDGGGASPITPILATLKPFSHEDSPFQPEKQQQHGKGTANTNNGNTNIASDSNKATTGGLMNTKQQQQQPSSLLFHPIAASSPAIFDEVNLGSLSRQQQRTTAAAAAGSNLLNMMTRTSQSRHTPYLSGLVGNASFAKQKQREQAARERKPLAAGGNEFSDEEEGVVHHPILGSTPDATTTKQQQQRPQLVSFGVQCEAEEIIKTTGCVEASRALSHSNAGVDIEMKDLSDSQQLGTSVNRRAGAAIPPTAMLSSAAATAAATPEDKRRQAKAARLQWASTLGPNDPRRWWTEKFPDGLLPEGSIGGSAFNLATNTLGAGTIALPAAFAAAGGVLGLFVLLICLAAAIYAMRLQVVVADMTGQNSYASKARVLVGPWAEKFMGVIVVVLCWGVTIVYVVSIGDLLDTFRLYDGAPSILVGDWGRRLVVTLFWAISMLPLSLPAQINSLRYASLAGLASTGVLIISLMVFAGTHKVVGADGQKHNLAKVSNIPIANFSLSAVMSLPVFIFGTACHTNTYQVYGELSHRSPRRMTLVAVLTFAAVGLLYLTCGLTGVAIFGEDTKGNILSNFNDPIGTWYITVAFVGMAITLTSAYPLCVFPARDALLQLAFGFKSGQSVPTYIRIPLSGMIAVVSLLLGLFVPGVKIMFGLLGGALGSNVVYIWPAIFALRTGKWTVANVGLGNVIGVWVLLAFGIFAGLFGTGTSVYDLVAPK